MGKNFNKINNLRNLLIYKELLPIDIFTKLEYNGRWVVK